MLHEMGETLYLLESRAKTNYVCPGCAQPISAGSLHFRHTPHPAAWIHRGRRGSHWCRECISAATAEPKEQVTGRIRVPALRVLAKSSSRLVQPLRVELIGIGRLLSEKLVVEPELVHRLTPEQFEEFVCDRLIAMGLEPKRIGRTNQKDGGIDVLFWPRQKNAFPFLGAAQIKHEHAKLIRLRDYGDIRRWMLGQFGEEEWRDLPNSIEVCPGMVVKVR
jgi:hypothetical protein